ncbi:hypothetical protein RJ639_015970 [Escallonia herrerae]|uniref:Isochorismatase-like domain-containing protein n=1 Tax=Escallonia herrerae TaxID=1293975 RepID=A0AA88VBM8_9ASTE|nr:hypothetical protein RJ639_015970 [Escallonia herrerae]
MATDYSWNKSAFLVIDMQEEMLNYFKGTCTLMGNQNQSLETRGGVGTELVDGLVIKKEDYKLVKTRFSAFFATNLHLFLQGAGVNRVIVTGVQTPNCIRQTVFDAVELDYESVSVIVDVTAAATPEIYAANVVDMRNVGVATPTLQQWCGSDG